MKMNRTDKIVLMLDIVLSILLFYYYVPMKYGTLFAVIIFILLQISVFNYYSTRRYVTSLKLRG